MSNLDDPPRLAGFDVDERLKRALASLRRRFGKRLAALKRPDAGDRLRALSKQPTKLHGKVKSGTGY